MKLTEQQCFVEMLEAARLKYQITEDGDQMVVTLGRLFLDKDSRVDVIFQFRNQNLDRVRVQRGRTDGR